MAWISYPFGDLSDLDRFLIRGVLLLRCDAFVKMEQRLTRNPVQVTHLVRKVALPILRPVDFWEPLRPWARLWQLGKLCNMRTLCGSILCGCRTHL